MRARLCLFLQVACLGALAVWLAGALSAQQAPGGKPSLNIYRTLAIPWVGAQVEYRAVLTDAVAGSRWEVVLLRRHGKNEEVLARGAVTAGEDGKASLPASAVFQKAAWYTIEARATAPGKPPLQATLQVPVTARRVDFAWYQAEAGHELRWPTVQLSCPEEHKDYWKNRGVIPARWCGAACGADKPIEHFIRGWSSHEAIAIDEFLGPPEHLEKFYKALVEARKLNPSGFIAVWFSGGGEYWPRLRDVIDLFLPEIYLNYLGFNLSRFDSYIRHARESGCFDKMLPGLGINVVTDDKGNVRGRPKPEEIVAQVRYLKQIAPDLRGLAFFTYSSAEPAVREAADQACEDYFLRPVADLVDFRISPVRGRPGDSATAYFTVRNAGGMPASSLQLWLVDGAEKKLAWKGGLEAGAESKLSFTWRPRPGWREATLKIAPVAGVTVLRGEQQAAVVRLASAAPLAFSRHVQPPAGPVPVFLPVSKEFAVSAAAPVSPAGKVAAGPAAPVQIIDGPDGRRAVWLDAQSVGGPKLWQLSQAQPPAKEAVHTSSEGATFTVASGRASFVLDASQDALTSIKFDGHEILASPWKMSWEAWRGFGEPTVECGPLGCVITVPVRNELIEGYSRYAFVGGFAEITRWFRPLAGEVEVPGAGEGARLEQRPGSFASMFGLGSPVGTGRLEVTSEYRDLYFGQISLAPEHCERAGWLDFAWDEPYPVGMGVAIARKWAMQASRVDYDVTRLYDAADWIEIAYVWGRPVAVGEEWSRVYLVPHGPMAVDRGQPVPAQALYDSVRLPAQLIK
ncbi:MAG: hypothetical protein N2512_05215 [Armatimonadetes bacterium]|nr:hypothetical protein [Armatimonadota bacterium]